MEVVRKRQRFTDHDDLIVLREVLGHNPFANSSLWEVIQENHASVTGKNFSLRTLRDHLELLIKIWLKQFKILKDKSGIEVVATEKDQLCENIYALMQEFSCNKMRTSTETNKKIKGIEARNRSAEEMVKSLRHVTNPIDNDCDNASPDMHTSYEECLNLDIGAHEEVQGSIEVMYARDIDEAGPSTPWPKPLKNNTPQPSPTTINRVTSASKPSTTVKEPNRSRKRKLSTQRQGLAYLEKYDATQLEVKKKEQEIEERKLAIEERRMTLMEKHFHLMESEMKKNYELVEKKINYEIEERKTLNKIIEKQDLLLNLLVSKLPQ